MRADWSSAFFEALGATSEEQSRNVGMLSQDEVSEGIKDLKIDEKPLNLIQRGAVRDVVRICRLICGTESSAVEKQALGSWIDEVAVAQAVADASSQNVQTAPALPPEPPAHLDRFKVVCGWDSKTRRALHRRTVDMN